MKTIQHRAQNALGDYHFWCDFGPAHHLLNLLAGVVALLLGLALAWGVFCALTQAQVLNVLLPLTLWRGQRN